MGLLMATFVQAGDEATAQGVRGTKTLAIQPVGDVAPEMAQRVRDFAERNLALPVRLAPRRDVVPGDLEAQGPALGDALGPDDAFLVALVWPTEEDERHAIYLYDSHTAVVNARTLKQGVTTDEQYGRRLEKLTMRSFGLLLGIDAVPNPQSAMFPYRTFEELDGIARGIDPPTLRRLQRAAMGRGLVLVKDSPFYWEMQ
jgi:hypothetical protein